jgi:hypothetical protein
MRWMSPHSWQAITGIRGRNAASSFIGSPVAAHFRKLNPDAARLVKQFSAAIRRWWSDLRPGCQHFLPDAVRRPERDLEFRG